ncbi:hypothetical protein BS47DRAFT_1391001 [Hydnum rufescens UP504]|uniref:Uncharacterized protein n=1 Tax=Hydnum rufescens UP504 TaxID=1448309 RepID=A0A9P6B228_9AGAM|nr:hypothetical protein BS47DRAFT_1391001 [Hydnum rufescens UP504]
MSGFTFTSAVTVTFTHIITLIAGFSSWFSSHLLTITTTRCIRGGYVSPFVARLFAEPLPTVEQMDAFWNGGEDDDEEEEEEEERLPDYVQPIRGKLYEDYLAWHEAGFDKLRKAKVAADEWMAVAARDAHDLMQLHGAIGKKKQKLSEFNACIIVEWRAPGRDNTARNEAKCRRCFAAYEIAKAAKKPPTASPHCPPQPASTLLTRITSPGLTPLESTPPEPAPNEPTSQPTHEPVPRKPTPEPTPREPTPEPAPRAPTPEPAPCKPPLSPHLASPLLSPHLVSPLLSPVHKNPFYMSPHFPHLRRLQLLRNRPFIPPPL